MKSRLFRLYGASVEDKVLNYARSVVHAWAESWTGHGVSDSAPGARLLDVSVASGQNWRHLVSDTEYQLGINTEGDWVGGIPEILYGSVCAESRHSHTGVLAQELLDSMFVDLAMRSLKSPASTEPRPEHLITAPMNAEAMLPGAGFMVVRISVTTTHHLWLLMSPQFIDSIVGTIDRKPSKTLMVSPVQAIGGRRITLQLAVGSGEISIEELSSLAVGDVIPLERKLNEKINVCISGDRPVCSGFIGVKQGKVAVQLLSNS